MLYLPYAGESICHSYVAGVVVWLVGAIYRCCPVLRHWQGFVWIPSVYIAVHLGIACRIRDTAASVTSYSYLASKYPFDALILDTITILCQLPSNITRHARHRVSKRYLLLDADPSNNVLIIDN